MAAVTHANRGIRPEWGEAESLHWKSDDFRVQGWLLSPRDFDPRRRYPLVVIVHGGPASAATPRWPGADSRAGGAVAPGLLRVLSPTRAAASARAKRFTRANVKDFGHGDLRDILAGVDEVLRTRPVDSGRSASPAGATAAT